MKTPDLETLIHRGQVLVRNPVATEKKIQNLIESGPSNVALLVDFDRTVTYYTDPSGRKGSTSHMALSDSGCLSERATGQVKQLYEHYHPIELMDMPAPEKAKVMVNWWHGTHEVLIREEVTQGDIQKALSHILIRDGFREFVNLAREKAIPIYILSAGLQNIIEAALCKACGDLSGIKIVANRMVFDTISDKGDNPQAPVGVSFADPLIHILNKNVLALPDHVDQKEWFILFGDSLHDLDMAGKKDQAKVLSIGFAINKTFAEALSRSYDLVLKGTSSFEFPSNLLAAFT